MPEATAKSEYFVGVDLGGTKILAGVFDEKLVCLGRTKMSTKSERGAEEVMDRIARCTRDVVDECDLDFKQVRAVGIGAPGAIDPETGRVIFAPNLQWQDVALKKIMEKQLGVPVAVENDCNSATLGVFEKELQGKPRYLVGVFIGTGLGGGIIADGKLYPGASGTAAEIGHMVIQVGGPKCNCGNRGCFEALASRTAIFRAIHGAVKDGQKTVLTEMLGPDLSDLRSGDLRKAIRKGDKLVEKIVEDAAEYTGVAVANLINILNPQTVVLGGGVIDALGDEMMAIIVETAEDYILSGTNKGVEILASKSGDDAGIIGGAVLARRSVK
ncbi:MAG TPA: ROK family protein [Verrucomicrobiae bacterium]|jgi:glucokinase